MNKQTFGEILSSAWYIYLGVPEIDLIAIYGYHRECVDIGKKLCEYLKIKEINPEQK